VTNPTALIRLFAGHKVASNLLMVIMMLMGLWGLSHIHTALNPPQTSRWVNVDITWPGASAEDIERLITQPVEYQFRSLKSVKESGSTSENSSASLWLEFERGTDMSRALDLTKQQFDQVRDLPSDMEPARIRISERHDLVAMVLLTSDGDVRDLASLARQFERDLLSRGITHINFEALPEEEIAIQISSQKLLELGSSLDQIASAISNTSRDMPFGSIGQGQGARELRSLDQQRDVAGFRQLPIKNHAEGDLLALGEIADVRLQSRDYQVTATQNQRPGIILRVMRAPGSDTIEAARILKEWHRDIQGELSAGVETKIFLEAWLFAQDQLSLVITNGLGGLVLVILALFLFLNGRVAWWVMLGIPVSFSAAVALFYALGGSINLVSLIALVMALGIVVDDAIVVGEHSLAQFERGLSPAEAAAAGAQRMFPPVMASSLTTMAAFLPLIIINDEVVRQIPLVMLLVIITSLVECFLIMPGHLRGSFESLQKQKLLAKSAKKLGREARFRKRFDAAFDHFRDQKFLPVLRWTLVNRRATVCTALAVFLLAFTLLLSGRIKPELNLNLDFEYLEAGVKFASGVSPEEKSEAMLVLENAMLAAEAELGGGIVVSHVSYDNMGFIDLEYKGGYEYANLLVELTMPNERTVNLETFNALWREKIPQLSAIETLQIQTGNDFNSDLSLHFKGGDTAKLKEASLELQVIMAQYPGVSNVYDDMPYGQEQWIFRLTPEGRQLGLTAGAIGRQIYSAYEGHRIQLFNDDGSEVEVRVKLPDAERKQLGSLRQFPIITPQGEMVSLATVANIESRRGINSIQHRNGELAVNINASIDKKITTSMTVIADLEKNVLPALLSKYELQYGLSGNSSGEGRMARDLMMGAAMSMLLIYIILAWIFSSYSWPLAVMVAIPLALTGALFGLQFLGMNLGVMSIMGLFTLAGVIVNDSIILVMAFKENRAQGMDIQTAIESAATGRLRAVILTSLTTSLGLMPMLLESSPMGEAMAPLATVICFGILYGTLLILMVIPALLWSIEHRRERRLAKTQQTSLIQPLSSRA